MERSNQAMDAPIKFRLSANGKRCTVFQKRLDDGSIALRMEFGSSPSLVRVDTKAGAAKQRCGAHPNRGGIQRSGDFDDFRILEYTIMGNLSVAELDALLVLTGSAPALGTSDPGDALVTLGPDQVQVRANQSPNGFSKVLDRCREFALIVGLRADDEWQAEIDDLRQKRIKVR